jgi:predicted transcriptional regulator
MMSEFVGAYADQSITRGGSRGAVSRATIGTEAESLVSANPRRSTVRIKNTHATNVLYVGFVDDVATTTGYAIAAVGGELELATTAAIYAIASGASTTVQVIEVHV